MTVSSILNFLKASLSKPADMEMAAKGLAQMGQLISAMPLAFFYNLLTALQGMGATDTSDVEVSQVVGNNKSFRVYHRGNYVAEIDFEVGDGDPYLVGFVCSFRLHFSPTAVESIERTGKVGRFMTSPDNPPENQDVQVNETN